MTLALSWSHSFAVFIKEAQQIIFHFEAEQVTASRCFFNQHAATCFAEVAVMVNVFVAYEDDVLKRHCLAPLRGFFGLTQSAFKRSFLVT